MHISPIEEILSDFKAGRFVILIDDENRENEGDLMVAAQFIDAKKINFMNCEARGLIYLAITSEHLKRLQLPLMKSDLHQSSPHHAAFTYSIEASKGVKSGISARDRATTILAAVNINAKPQDIHCPGHVFPIVARDGGVIERRGHTEAAVELAKLAGLNKSTVACEILDDSGDSASRKYLAEFSIKQKIKVGTIEDLVKYVGLA